MFERMTAYASAEVMGLNCSFLQGSDLQQPGLVSIKAAIGSCKNGYAILRNYRKDGSIYMNELFISPVKDSKGGLTHFVGIQRLRLNETVPGRNL